MTRAEIEGVEDANAPGGEEPLVQLLHHRRVGIGHSHQLLDVLIHERGVEGSKGFVE